MTGVYIALKPTEAALEKIIEIQKLISLPELILKDQLHCTLMYDSFTEKTNYLVEPNLIHKATISGCALFGKNEYNAIVLILDSIDIHNRFNFAVSSGLKFDYPEYTPHISLVYQKNNPDIDSFLDIIKNYLSNHSTIEIELNNEYIEKLNPYY